MNENGRVGTGDGRPPARPEGAPAGPEGAPAGPEGVPARPGGAQQPPPTGAMRLVCAGTGTAAPEADRACSGYWVEAGACRLLLDCGPGVVHSMARQRLPWTGLTHLLLTHFHNDHTGDVPFLLFALHYGLAEPRSAPLSVLGPVGTAQLFERLGAAFGSHVASPRFELSIRELAPGDDVALPGLRIRTCPVLHTPGALAWRLDAEGGGSICYTGDTGEATSLGEFMRHADILVAECSLPDAQAEDSHLTPSRLARLAMAAAPAVLVVTHVYPQLSREDLPGLLAAAGWEGRTSVASDGLSFVTDGGC